MPGFKGQCEPYFLKTDLNRVRGFSTLCKVTQKVFTGNIADLAKKAEVSAIEFGIAIKEMSDAEESKKKESSNGSE